MRDLFRPQFFEKKKQNSDPKLQKKKKKQRRRRGRREGKFNMANTIKHGAKNAALGGSSASECERHCQTVCRARWAQRPRQIGRSWCCMFRFRQQGSRPVSVWKQYFVPHVLNEKHRVFLTSPKKSRWPRHGKPRWASLHISPEHVRNLLEQVCRQM